MSLPLDLNSFSRDVSLDTLEKQLICPICLEVFTKPVVILPCQHNLCRKCANELYQVGIGGRFRCPSCRHEVVLDRHGVYGLQRNLLVENIIDVYKQTCESSRPSPKPLAQITCEEHEGEKLNIYCITCQVPTCSLCKVFGAHSTCHVAPLPEVYQQQKDELSEGIGTLVATNKCIQGCINNLEEICKNIEENGQNQKEILCEKFDHMCGILEERRKFMMQQITYEQDEKTGWTRSLVHTYSEQVDTNSKLVQTSLNAMEEPEMAAFLQTSKDLIEKVSEGSKCTPAETIVPGYENMDHYKVDFNAQERALYQLDFINTEEEVEDIPDPEPEPESEPELEPESEPESELESDPESKPEPEAEPEPEPMLSLIPVNSGEDQEPNSESWGIKRAVSETREDFQPQEGTRAETKKDVCEKTGWNTQQGMSTLRCEGHDAGEETKLYPSWYRPHSRQILYSDQARPTDTLDVLNHASLLVREPSVQHPFRLPQTLLSMQMSGSLISMATENHKCLGSGSLDSAQGHGSEVEKNLSDLEERSANRDRVTSITPQGEPCSLGTQDNREMEQSIDTPFHNNSDRETETGRQTVSQAAAAERSVVGPSTSPVPSESIRLSFSFSWLNPLAKKK